MSVEWKTNGEWFQVSPFGEFPNRVGKREIVMVMDREGLEAQAAALKARSELEGEKFGGLLINQDHLCVAKETMAESTTAAMGWIVALEVRPDGLWAKAKWSTEGERLVGGGVYKFVSGEWSMESADDLGGGRVRLRELTGCALTNQPLMPGLEPLCCRHLADDSPAAIGNVKKNEPEEPAEREKNMDTKELAALLGLGENATPEDISAAVKKLLEKLNTLEEVQKEVEAAEFVSANAEKIEDEEAVKAAYKRDPAGTAAVLAAVKKPSKPAELPVTARVPAKTPASAGYTAPDGKVYASRTEYYGTLTGAARKKFRTEHYEELMAEARNAQAAK